MNAEEAGRIAIERERESFVAIYDRMVRELMADFCFELDLKFREAYYGSAYGPYLIDARHD